jgi:hypothetical protein
MQAVLRTHSLSHALSIKAALELEGITKCANRIDPSGARRRYRRRARRARHREDRDAGERLWLRDASPADAECGARMG